MVNMWDGDPESYGLAMGTLDDDPRVRPSRHIYVASKAPWFEITVELPQFDAEDLTK